MMNNKRGVFLGGDTCRRGYRGIKIKARPPEVLSGVTANAAAVKKERRGEIGVCYVNKKALPNHEEGQSRVLGGLKQKGFIHSILDSDSPVNAKSVKQENTKQFGHWFAGSEIKNADGTAKIMYRGGREDIAIFDRKKLIRCKRVSRQQWRGILVSLFVSPKECHTWNWRWKNSVRQCKYMSVFSLCHKGKMK